MEEVVRSEGWTKAGLDQMHKIDSFIKESQRLNPLWTRKFETLLSFVDFATNFLLVLLSRVAVDDFTFSDGTTIPRGTFVSVSTDNAHLNHKVYEDPLKFDGFQFSKMRDGSAKNAGMVSSSPDHISPWKTHLSWTIFCCLRVEAHVCARYDVKLEIEGVRPPDKWIMGSRIPNPNANVLFRNRAIVSNNYN